MATSYSYTSLPAELLGRVAELVHEQDLAFAASPVPRAVPGRGENLDVEVNVPAGTWSKWYGRGIRALVQVDRRSRASAVPFLYERITQKQTAKLYFRLHVLGERLGDLVRHVDVGEDYVAGAAFLACALCKLPNLSSLQLSWRSVSEVLVKQGLTLDEDLEALRSSLRSALGKVTSLQMEAVGDRALLEVLDCVDQTRLRKLHWVGPVWPSQTDLEVERVVSKLVSLAELEISWVELDDIPEVQRRLRLPMVRSIVLSNHQMSYEESLAFAHDIAPSLVRLTVIDPEPASLSDHTPEPLPSTLLPALKSLIVEADTYLPAFHQVDLPALEYFNVSLKKDCDYFPLDVDEVPFRAAPLRTITLAFRGHPWLEPSEALVQACRAADVRLLVQLGPASVRELRTVNVEEVDVSPLVKVADDGKRDTILDTLDWARRRAQWLYDVEDGPGLHELAEATVRLHERYLLDRA